MKYFTYTFKAIFVVVSIFLGTVSISAADFVVDGIYYNILSAENKTCAVTFAGATYDEIQDEYVGDVIIPTKTSNEGIEYDVTTIGRYAFRECKNIVSMILPNSITTIEVGTFMNCNSLLNLTIPEKVELIPTYMCMGCSSLQTINIPEGLHTIDNYAFSNTAISTITLPYSITNLNKGIFKNTDNLTTIKLFATIPPTLKADTFDSTIRGRVTVEVPEESVTKYKEDENWGQFTSRIVKLDISTGVDISLTNESDIVEYYNILGVKVENPTKGLYIKKCGGKAYKVML